MVSLVTGTLAAQAAAPKKVLKHSFTNPMSWSDLPDPDVIRVGKYFYMVTTTMHLMPGAPVMRSADLVNWETIGYVFDRLTDSPKYDMLGGTVYGRGQWATSLKYHKGTYYALFAPNDNPGGDSYIYSATNPAGPWTEVSRLPHFHDASLFFDDDDQAYVIYDTGRMCRLTSDLKGVVEGSQRQLFVREADETGLLEGSRMVKYRGTYYLLMISWPQGKPRRQVCYRADRIEGPYTKRTILQSEFGGFSYVGQGTIVDAPDGRWYGVIFQDRGAVGRVLTLMPCTWRDGWPMLGDAEGKVPLEMELPVQGSKTIPLVTSDSFEASSLNFQWQWNHNPVESAWSLTERRGSLRLHTSRVAASLFTAPNTLTCRMEGPACSGSVVIDVSQLQPGDKAGLAVFNGDSGMLTLSRNNGRTMLTLSQESVQLGDRDKEVTRVDTLALHQVTLSTTRVWLRIDGDFRPRQDFATFYYSTNGKEWKSLGEPMKMKFDYRRFFMGTRYALFCYATQKAGGWADFESFHYQVNNQSN
jgi:beta-xylosidase